MIPTLNRYDLLNRCLASIFDGTVCPSRVLVIDNGGSFSTARSVEVVRPASPLSVAASWNLGHRLITPDSGIYINDDVVVGPQAIAELSREPETPAGLLADVWACFYMPEFVWQIVGEFDERFCPAYYEDVDYAARMQTFGIPFREVDSVGSSHEKNGTIKGMADSADIFAAIDCNRILFQAKWERSTKMHPEAFDFVSRIRTEIKPTSVVEIGSRDVNGSVRPLFEGLPYVGVDAVAGPGVDVVANGRGYRPELTPDCIVCCECLEHTPFAQEICVNAFEILAPGGVLILTAAGEGRAAHSGIDGHLLRPGEEFYRNVTETMLREWLSPFHRVTITLRPPDIYAVAWR